MSRRDDMINLFYVLVFIYTGTLPWINRDTLNPKKMLSHALLETTNHLKQVYPI